MGIWWFDNRNAVWNGKAQIPLGSSRLDKTRYLAHAFWHREKWRDETLRVVLRFSDSTVRHARHDERDTSCALCRVETWPANWNLVLTHTRTLRAHFCYAKRGMHLCVCLRRRCPACRRSVDQWAKAARASTIVWQWPFQTCGSKLVEYFLHFVLYFDNVLSKWFI